MLRLVPAEAIFIKKLALLLVPLPELIIFLAMNKDVFNFLHIMSSEFVKTKSLILQI